MGKCKAGEFKRRRESSCANMVRAALCSFLLVLCSVENHLKDPAEIRALRRLLCFVVVRPSTSVFPFAVLELLNACNKYLFSVTSRTFFSQKRHWKNIAFQCWFTILDDVYGYYVLVCKSSLSIFFSVRARLSRVAKNLLYTVRPTKIHLWIWTVWLRLLLSAQVCCVP